MVNKRFRNKGHVIHVVQMVKNQLLVRDNQWEDKGVFDIARLYRTSDIKI